MQQGQSGGSTVLAKRVNLAYDAAGELQKLSRYSDTAGTQLVSTSDYAFDRLGRLTFLQHSQANREIASYRMAYDVLDRLTRLDDAIDEVSLYGYDTLGQLTTADHTFENDESYTYDANGNRTGAGYDTSVTNNQLDSDPNYNYTFDAEGNRASRTSKATGNIEEYAYDQRNRLTDVTFKNSAGTVVRTLHYDYDGFDRKVARKVGTASAEYYVYDGDDVVLDFLDGDGTGPNPAALAERYLFGPAVDQVLAQENVVSGAGQTVLWHLTDNLGSVRDLVRSDGTTAAHYQYDAFGNLLDGFEDLTRYQFTGRERDPDTGLQYNRARWYDPQSGQWMSEDPIGFSAGDANLRRYVGNGATNHVDPTGHRKIWLLWPFWSTEIQDDPGTMMAGPFEPPLTMNLYFDYVCGDNPETVDWYDWSMKWGKRGGQGMAIGGTVGAAGVTIAGVGGTVIGGGAVTGGGTIGGSLGAIGGLTATQIQALIASSGDRVIPLFTRLAQNPSLNRVLHASTDTRLCNTIREGTLYVGRIPADLYQRLVYEGSIQIATTQMGGVTGVEVIISAEAMVVLGPYFKPM